MSADDFSSPFPDPVDYNAYHSEKNERAQRLGIEHAALEQKKQEIDNRLRQVGEEIALLADEDTEEHTFETEKCTVSVSRTERWTWDTESLESILGSPDNWPEYVKKSVSVDKRRFQKLPQEEQERLKPALTRSLNKPKVKVQVKSNV